MGERLKNALPLRSSEILREAVSHPALSHHPRSNTAQQSHNTKHDYRKHGGDESEPGAHSYGERTTRIAEHEGKEILQADHDQEMVLKVQNVFSEINETLEAVLLDDSMRILVKVPVSDIVKQIGESEGGKFLVLDGIVTQRLIDVADRAGIEYIVGHRTIGSKKPSAVKVHTFEELGIPN